VSARAVPEELDGLLLCYCTGLTIGELRRACAQGRWPTPGKEHTGKLCTGCLGDLLHCLRRFGAPDKGPILDAAPDG
jgi:hypothetical protein